jgi:hypothetical protein
MHEISESRITTPDCDAQLPSRHIRLPVSIDLTRDQMLYSHGLARKWVTDRHAASLNFYSFSRSLALYGLWFPT